MTTAVDRRVGAHVGAVAAVLDPDELGRALADTLRADIPEISALTDDDFHVGLVMSCTSNLHAIRDGLLDGSEFDDVTPPDDARAWAFELVHRGMPLAALLRAYRLGHEEFMQAFERAASLAALHADTRWRVLADATRRTFRYIDTICTQLVDDYEAEREQWLRGSAAAQVELIHALLAGEDLEPRAAAEALRHDLDACHVGVIVWVQPRGAGPLPSPATAATELCAALGTGPALVLPAGGYAAWAWTTVPAGAEPQVPVALPDRVGAAIGRPHAGLDGFRITHQEARAARRVGEVFATRPGRVLRYQQVALHALVSADPAQALRFVDDELGTALGADSDAMRRLRATLRVYLEERCSPARAARRIGVHQNTVAYRVRRAEELLGHSLDERRLELELALRLREARDGLRAAAGPARPAAAGP